MSRFAPADISLAVPPTHISFERSSPYDNILQCHTATIQAYNFEGPEDTDYLPVGRLSFGILDVGQALNERESLYEVCDAHSSQYHSLHARLFATNGNLKTVVSNAIGGVSCDLGVIYVEALFIEPEHRGAKLGLAALYALMRGFSRGCGLVVLNASPLQSGDGLPTTELIKAQAALRKHYAQIGFNRIGKSTFMGLSLDYRLPKFPG